MNSKHIDSERERLFVLRLMDFVYRLWGRPLQFCLQQMLDAFHKDEVSYFTPNIAQAILLCITDYRTCDINLVDLSSQAYQEKVEKLSNMYDSEDFLSFIALYSWNSANEYYNHQLLDSPAKFYSSIIRLLEVMRKNGQCDDDFWKHLDETAEKIHRQGLERIKYRNRQHREVSEDTEMTSEREFVLGIMRMIFSAYRKPLPDNLRRALDKFLMQSQLEFDQNKLEAALSIAMEDLERNVTNLGNDQAIYEYYFNLSRSSFTPKNFLECCVCFTRKALFAYLDNPRNDSPWRTYDRLMSILQVAKQEGRFYSVEDLMDGASEIIDNDNQRRMQSEQKTLTTSNEFCSDSTTERDEQNSDWIRFTTPFIRVPRAAAMYLVTNAGNTKPASEPAITSGENTQKVNSLEEHAELATNGATSSSENTGSASENTLISRGSTLDTSGSEDLMGSCKHEDTCRCKCCKSCCTTA